MLADDLHCLAMFIKCLTFACVPLLQCKVVPPGYFIVMISSGWIAQYSDNGTGWTSERIRVQFLTVRKEYSLLQDV